MKMASQERYHTIKTHLFFMFNILHSTMHRMTRHFYDLEKLMQTPYAEMALNDLALYHEIVEHRRKFYHVGYVDYDKELPATIQIV